MSQSTQSLISKLVYNEKIRFGLVGALNTLVDFCIFLTLAELAHVETFVANIISTTCAVAISYLLNKKTVFKDTDPSNKRQVALFIIVTLSGLWILQNVIIFIVSSGLSYTLGSSNVITLLVAKLIATVASLVWNYLWYSRVIFNKVSHEKSN